MEWTVKGGQRITRVWFTLLEFLNLLSYEKSVTDISFRFVQSERKWIDILFKRCQSVTCLFK